MAFTTGMDQARQESSGLFLPRLLWPTLGFPLAGRHHVRLPQLGAAVTLRE